MTANRLGDPRLQSPVDPDYVRQGTPSLFAALDAKAGTVIGECLRGIARSEFRRSLDTIDATVPTDLDVHLILDNYATHKTAAMGRRFAKRPRYYVYFTPTSTVVAQPCRTLSNAGLWS